jgi:hypothetical protein
MVTTLGGCTTRIRFHRPSRANRIPSMTPRRSEPPPSLCPPKRATRVWHREAIARQPQPAPALRHPRQALGSPNGQGGSEVAGDLVFTAPAGGVLRLQTFPRRSFDPAARSVGLAGLTPARAEAHGRVSRGECRGQPETLQRMLGHKSAAMTLDTDSGLYGDDLDAVAERLDAATQISRVPLVCPEATVTPITLRKTSSDLALYQCARQDSNLRPAD